MRSKNERDIPLEDDSYRELRLLEEVDETPDMSQRTLSHRLGVALGMTNLLIRNGAKKGYIRVTQIGWKRWAYVITPKGMARKLNLTMGYIERFIGHYQRVRLLLNDDLQDTTLNAESRVALVGTTEIAELAYLALRDIGVEEIEVFDIDGDKPRFLGMPVQQLEDVDPDRFVKLVITNSKDSNVSREGLLTAGVSESQIVELLNHRPTPLSQRVDGDGEQ